MRSDVLRKYLSADAVTSRVIDGVYVQDTLPEQVAGRPRAFVCNTDPSDQEGEHWVAFYFDQDMTADYYDPYGLPPVIPSWIRFLNNNCDSWRHNPIRLQEVDSSTCGHHVLYFLLHRSRGVPLETVLSHFTSTKNDNDSRVINFLMHHYGLKRQ